MATPSVAMIPTGFKQGKLYSVLPEDGSGDFEFTRASAATRVNEDGLIDTVGYTVGGELITNGDFANSSDWTTVGFSIGGGSASADGSQVSGISLSQSNIFQSGSFYLVTFDLTVLAGNINFWINGTQLIESSIQSGSKTFYVDATTTGSIYFEGDSSFSGSIDKVSTFEYAGEDVPRLDYTDGGCPVLLTEPQSTNEIQYSEDFSNAYWTKAQSGSASAPIVTSNYAISPDGTQNADRVQFNLNGGTTGSDIGYVVTFPSLGTVDATTSIYLKTNDGSTKSVTLRLGVTLFDYDVTVTPNWERFTLSGNTSVDRLQLSLYGTYNSQSADLSVWGAQVEELPYATSYIPTSGGTATRAAESCFGSGDANDFNSTQGVLFAEIATLSDDGISKTISLSDGSLDNSVFIEYFSSTDRIRLRVYSGGTLQGTIQTVGATITDLNKVAVRWGNGFMSAFLNGAIYNVPVVISSSPVGLDTLSFSLGQGSAPFYGKTSQVQVFKTALSDSELQTLTTL